MVFCAYLGSICSPCTGALWPEGVGGTQDGAAEGILFALAAAGCRLAETGE